MATVMKTPGVFIEEKSAFPNSVVEVETAIPAFIGYTQKAEFKGATLRNRPWQISSLSEFHEIFGFAPHPMFELSLKARESSLNTAAASENDGVAPTDHLAESPPVAQANAKSAVAEVVLGDKVCTFEQSAGEYTLYYHLRLFFANGGGKCFIVSVGSYEDDLTGEALSGGLTPLSKELQPTMIVIPDAVNLGKNACRVVQQQMLLHCANMKNRMAILDVWGGWKDLGGSAVDDFRAGIGTNSLKYGAAYFPWLETSVLSARDIGVEHIGDKDRLAELLISELDADTLKKIKAVTYSALELQGMSPGGKERADLDTLDKTVRAQSTIYRMITSELRDKLNLLPPSAAMAGIYTRVDNQRGVWKSPANVGMSMVSRPAVKVSNSEQESIQLSTDGKSINVIREFVAEGAVVWGARTLAGNSMDWRYISVTRTIMMLEESMRLAVRAFVFEPNTANTWVSIRSMIENFLNSVWKQGGLAGAVPSDAFSVHVGLGDTMTPVDILEGILRITVLVAVSRPAEFIEINFQQQMQKSGD